MIFQKFRWFCGLFLAFSFAQGAAYAKKTRGQLLCRTLVAGALVGVGGWWATPGEAPHPPPLAYAKTDLSLDEGADLEGARFRFSPVLETRILNEGWLAQSVATRVKAKLAQENPQLAQLPGWKDSGIRVPVEEILFEVDEEGRPRVVARSPFLTLTSTEPVCLASLGAGQSIETDFYYERETRPGEGAQMAIRMVLQFDGRKLRVLTGSGTFRVYGTLFEYEEPFVVPPWEGELQ